MEVVVHESIDVGVSGSSAQLDDEELVRRIAAGERAWEEALFRRFAARIRWYGLRHLRAEAPADDLVQQVLVVVIERIRAGKVRDPARLASFVLGTARMLAQALRSGEARRQRLDDEYAAIASASAPADDGRLDEERLRRCVERLPQRERTVVMLTFYGDRSGEEIAAELGTTTGNVRVVRHRAMGRLQGCMGLEEGGA